jgi:uncharacterized protein YcfJ
MSRILYTGLIAIWLLAPMAQADSRDRDDWRESRHQRHHDRYDYAKVVDVDPIIQRERIRVEREVCWNEQVRVRANGYRRGDAVGGALVGGVIGGVVGHELGRDSHHHQAGTVVGVAVGATLGHELAGRRHERYETVTERRCAVKPDLEYHETVSGYRVKYRYRGQVYHTTTADHPGKRIRVKVDVAPVHRHG